MTNMSSVTRVFGNDSQHISNNECNPVFNLADLPSLYCNDTFQHMPSRCVGFLIKSHNIQHLPRPTQPTMSERKEIDVTDLNEATNHGSSDLSPAESSLEPPVDEVKLLRKVDWHLLPILFAVYVVAFLDRQVL